MTAQMKESLLYKGETVALSALPLDPYLESHGLNDFKAPNTMLWRGYVGHWEIEGDKLLLIDFVGFSDGNSKFNLNDLFPGEPKVFANWFSGKLTIPRGELLYYFHGGFGGIYKEDQILTIEKGVLTSEKWVNNEERAKRVIAEDEERANDPSLPF